MVIVQIINWVKMRGNLFFLEIDEMKKQIEDLKNQLKRPQWNVSG